MEGGARKPAGRVVAATHGGGVFEATVGGAAPTCVTRSADVSGDNQVDVTDLTRIVNHTIGQQILSPEARICADVSNDGSIDIVDVVQTVRIILNERAVPQSQADPAPLAWHRSWTPNRLHLSLESNELAAFQIDVELAPGTTLSGAPRVDGIAAHEIVWHQSGSRLVILGPPDLGLSPRAGVIDLELDLASTTSQDVDAPVSVRVLGVSPAGTPLVSFEREIPSVSGELAILSLGPNPTRGAIEMRYRSPSAAPVRMSIHDASGRQVHSIEETAGAGEQSLSWDGRDESGRNVASGTYFVRIQSEGRIGTRSFQVLR